VSAEVTQDEQWLIGQLAWRKPEFIHGSLARQRRILEVLAARGLVHRMDRHTYRYEVTPAGWDLLAKAAIGGGMSAENGK
jgi:ribosomal protein S19E (S16A)